MKTLLKKKGIIGLLLAFMLVFPFITSMRVYAESTAANPAQNLASAIAQHSYTPKNVKARSIVGATTDSTGGIDASALAQLKYKTINGGFLGWADLTSVDPSEYINPTAFSQLTPGAKQNFLKEVFGIANLMAADTAAGYLGDDNGVTDETVDNMMHVIQNYSGMGSSMLATLLANTKPNYASANRLFQPFSGVVGTILGVIAIAIMALLGVTMALDLAYINIPAFQMFCNDDGSDGEGSNKSGGKKASGIGGLISQEAKNAVNQAANQEGGNGDKGNQKSATGLYFKSRWKGLLLLGICLLYLVQGQLYALVAWVIDLVSGFIGA